MKRKVKIAPSILSADFTHLGHDCRAVERAGADRLHVDVMDGRFVPNISIGVPVVASLKHYVRIPLDVHLMIEHPHHFVGPFAEAGADILTFHIEACRKPGKTIGLIKDRGLRAGISLNPDTKLESVKGIIREVDLVLIMSVHPGFAGQKFLVESLEKIRELRKFIDERELELEIEVDGGIGLSNARDVFRSGADVLVAGASVFGREDATDALRGLRRAAEAA